MFGILITLLLNFLASKTDHRAWFKIYVVTANLLTGGQTIIHVVQAFEIIDLAPVCNTLVLAAPVLTGLINVLVQAFFIYRCWRIYQQHVPATIPLVLLSATSLVSAIMIGAYLAKSLIRPPDEVIPGANISNSSVEIWTFSSLAFDMITTLSTILYFFRVRKDLNARQGILAVVWQILWASAAPPLILILISIIDEHMNPFPIKVHTEAVEFTTGTEIALKNRRYEEPGEDNFKKDLSDAVGLKSDDRSARRTTHNFSLPLERGT
ncbi:hypothetical protein FRC11_008991 [Ceratobasidium sp. 423]|nr:hypothetical protein FRC11_008991 [Ceratobasidium sp. 423]